MTLSPKAQAYLMHLPPGSFARKVNGIDGAPVKRRKAVGTGDHSKRKAWLREQAAKPGIFLDWRLINPMNEHAANKWAQIKRAKGQRADACFKVQEKYRSPGSHSLCMPPLPVTVTITRYGKMTMDEDGLRSACKNLRDGIADAWGKGTNDRDGLHFTWVYKQEFAPFAGVRIELKYPHHKGGGFLFLCRLN